MRLLASATRLQQVRRLQATPTKAGPLFRNFIPLGPVDPGAHIVYKIGKPLQLAYRACVSVNTLQHIITYIQAYLVDGCDSRIYWS
jgi:hypothetical protein